MRILLDTHTLLWFLSDDSRLNATAYPLITDAETTVLVSVASLWEIVLKNSLGKLPLPGTFEDVIPPQLMAERIDVLPITVRHLAALRQLPFHHRDPFDRLLIAQALAEGVPVLTHDAAFRTYAVDVVEAGPRSPA